VLKTTVVLRSILKSPNDGFDDSGWLICVNVATVWFN